MNKYQSLLAVAAAAIGFLGAPAAANAFSLGGNIDGEAAFDKLDATIGVAAEGRIGDLSGAAEHEFNIHFDNGSGGQIVPTEYRRFDWESGKAEDFTLTFENDLLTYEIGGRTLTQTVTDNFNDLFIRTTARKQDSSVLVNNLFMNGVEVGGTSSFACDIARCGYYDSSQYLHLTDIGENFTLTGTTTMSWVGNAKRLSDRTAPHRSELAFQVKLGNKVETPEPASMSLLAAGVVGAGLAGLSRRQKGEI